MLEVIWAAKLTENEFQVLKNPNKGGRMAEERKEKTKKDILFSLRS